VAGVVDAPLGAEHGRDDQVDLRREISEQLATIHALDEKRRSILDVIENLDRHYAKAKDRFESLTARLHGLEARRSTLGASQTDVAKGLTDIADHFRARMISLYKINRHRSYLVALIKSKDVMDLMHKAFLIRRLSRFDSRLISRHREEMARLQTMLSSEAELARELDSLRQHVAVEVRALEREQHKKRMFLMEVIGRKNDAQLLLVELSKQSERLKAELLLRHSGDAIQTNFPAMRRQLLPPVDGPLSKLFGPYQDPDTQLSQTSRGWTFRVPAGARVHAVHRGRVIFSGYYKGYGKLVIIDHGDKYYSLYAYNSELLVTVDDQVEAGSLVGRAGEIGLTDRSGCYFELRKAGEPIDPADWILMP